MTLRITSCEYALGHAAEFAGRPEYCLCENESSDPCPACGATVAGNDAVNGICQARKLSAPPTNYGITFALVHRDTGEFL